MAAGLAAGTKMNQRVSPSPSEVPLRSVRGDELQCLVQVSILAVLSLKEGLAYHHAASMAPHKSQLAYISESIVNVGHVALIMMQTSNHYFSAQSASLRRQASTDGLFSVVFFLLPFLFFF